MRVNVVNYMDKYCWWGSEMIQSFCKNSLAISYKGKHTFTYDPVILFQGAQEK